MCSFIGEKPSLLDKLTWDIVHAKLNHLLSIPPIKIWYRLQLSIFFDDL